MILYANSVRYRPSRCWMVAGNDKGFYFGCFKSRDGFSNTISDRVWKYSKGTKFNFFNVISIFHATIGNDTLPLINFFLKYLH